MASEYKFVDTDADVIVAAMVKAYEALTGKSTAPASPERLFITWAADVIVQLRSMINYAANQNIPSRAEGENLDAIAELFYEKTRPAASAAQCTMRFTISAAQSSSVIVPAGTRITDVNNTLIWATTADIVISAGNLSATGTAVCQTAGQEGNGWVAGQITELVDVYSYYDSCQNITTSDGGTDELTDAEFYELLRESEDAYSTAGSYGAYVYWAKSASTDIADVIPWRPVISRSGSLTVYDHHAFLGGYSLEVDTMVVKSGNNTLALNTDYEYVYEDGLLTISLLQTGGYYNVGTLSLSIADHKPGCVWIYGLMNDGTIPSAEVKSLMLSACNAASVRPLTDEVAVKDPTSVSYNINLTYYMPLNSDLSGVEMASAVDAAVEEYKTWQSTKLGRDINPSKLIALLMATGIKRVNVTSPVFRELSDGSGLTPPELAVVGTVSVTNGGYEDE